MNTNQQISPPEGLNIATALHIDVNHASYDTRDYFWKTSHKNVDRKNLNVLERLLKSGDRVGVESFVDSAPSGMVLSRKFLKTARIDQYLLSIIFLSSLERTEKDARDECEKILEFYRSLLSKLETPNIKTLSPAHVLRWSVNAAIAQNTQKTVDTPKRKLRGSLADFILAIELLAETHNFDAVNALIRAIDHKDNRVFIDSLGHLYEVLQNKRLTATSTLNSMGDVCGILIKKIVKNDVFDHRFSGELFNVLNDLRLKAADFYSFARNSDAAIKWLDAVILKNDLVEKRVLITRARALASCDKPRDACKVLDDLLRIEIANPTSLFDGLNAEMTDTFSNPRRKSFHVAEHGGLIALQALTGLLESSGKKPFLVSGTLLGFIREGKILDHDKDIDLGIIGDDNSAIEIASKVLTSGEFTLRTRYLLQGDLLCMPIWHLGTGVGIDLFFYYPRDNKFITGVNHEFGYTQKFAFSSFGIEARNFDGLTFYVPTNPERKLLENFGDWQVPDPEYISHLESPSTCDVGGDVYMLVARLNIFSAISKGNLTKARRALNCAVYKATNGLSLPEDLKRQILLLVDQQERRS